MYTKLATWLAVVTTAAILANPSVATAQDPVRLPRVQVTAPMEKPHAHAIVGVVRDTFAIGIDSVEITIPELKLRAFTDGEGKFRLDKVGRGEYSVRARKIGYTPQVRTVKVDDDGGVGEFELLQFRRTLAPVVVNAARGGLGGVVGDSAFRALPGVEVRLMEQGFLAETDSSGYFHFDVGPGQYFVSVQREGYLDRTLAVRIPEDSGRRVTVFLEPGKRSVRSAHNVDDFRERLAWRRKDKSSLYSHDDLVDMGVEWVGDVIQGAVTRIAEVKVREIDRDCVGILNGGPETVMLSDLTIDDVSAIEVYPSAPAGPSLARPKRTLVGTTAVANSRAAIRGQLTNVDRATMQNGARSCAVVYVWTK
jgi:hypothetical protein